MSSVFDKMKSRNPWSNGNGPAIEKVLKHLQFRGPIGFFKRGHGRGGCLNLGFQMADQVIAFEGEVPRNLPITGSAPFKQANS
jgi:hypothetical protein